MKFFTLLLFSVSTCFSFSQEFLRISGQIIDNKNQPLAFVSVKIFEKTENKLIKGDFSDEEGKFLIDIEEGSYYLTFLYSGLHADTLFLNKTTGDAVVTVVMDPISEIDDVVVTAQKAVMEYQLDKRVYNVDADINNQGANAVEVLENIPSITVDAEGNISLRGNPNVRILIDGKMSGFATNADALQQLRSDNIERIEVITNASSRYDAQGEGGIINIVMKKNQTKGFNGSVALRAGYFPEYGADIRLNYRVKKINVFATYSFNHNIRPGYSTTYQRLNNADTAFAYRQNYEHSRSKISNHGSFGLDYFINENNSLSTSFTIRSGLGNNTYDRFYDNLDLNDNVIGFNDRYEKAAELEDLLEANLSYTKRFKKKGEWVTDIKWFRDQDIEKSDYNETASSFAGERLEYSQVSTFENNLLAQTDFSFPIFKQGKVETGYRMQWRKMDNSFRFGERVGEAWHHPSIYNDVYNYNEKVHAVYLMASNTWKKFSAQGGMRVEYTDINTLQNSNQERIMKNYMDLFPSAAFSYKTTDRQTIQLSYSRRISRPGQWDLMPFTKFGDNRERRIGNSQLNPEYTNSFEAGILQLFGSGSFLGTIYYRSTTDKIERISALAEDGIIYLTPLNIATKDAYGAELNFTLSPVKWFRLNTGFNLFKEVIAGDYNNEDFRRNNFTWTNRTSINFIFPKVVKAQLAFNYVAPSVRPQGKTLAMYHFDFGLSRELLKGKATLSLNVRDLFNTRRWRSIIDTPELYASSNTLWRPRSIVLVFTYRFNQQRKENDFNLIEEN